MELANACENCFANIMNPVWFITTAVCLITAWKILPIVRSLFFWVSADPVVFEPFGVDQLPQSLRARIEAIVAELTLLGFRTIGTCRWKSNNKRTVCYVVLVRNDMVAEVAFTVEGGPRTASVKVAIGQEYMDLTSVVVSNSRPNFLGEYEGEFYLSRVWDLSRLDQVSQAIVAKKRGNRMSYIPASAIEYKTKDTKNWLNEVVNIKYFRLDSKRNRYRPTWRYLACALRFQLNNWRPFRRGNDENTKKMNRILEELGLREPRPKAFPVILDSDSSPENASNDR